MEGLKLILLHRFWQNRNITGIKTIYDARRERQHF